MTRDGNIVEIEDTVLRQPIYATDFGRYLFAPENRERILFPYVVSATGYRLLQEPEFRGQYPQAYSYLSSCKHRLACRKHGGKWYGYSAPRNLHLHEHAHFLVPLLADRGLRAPAPSNGRRFCMMASAGFTVTAGADLAVDPLYLLGLVNSKLLFWKLQTMSNKLRGGSITCTKQYFGALPIRSLDRAKREERLLHDGIVEDVGFVVALTAELSRMQGAHDRGNLQRQLLAAEARVNQRVYQLYGLTDAEIQIVEEATQ